MKTLFLVRHAQAINRNLGIPDFERYLVKRGDKETKKIIIKFKELEMQPDLFISSPATRALETAQIFTDMLGIPENRLKTEQILYEASSGISFIELLKNLDDNYHIVCLVGHEPTLSDCALYLVKDFKGGIPKSGVVGIEFEATSWKDVSPANARHKFNLYPNEKVKVKNIKKKELQSKITVQIKKMLLQFDNNMTEEMIELIDKSGEKIARNFLKKMKKHKK